MPPGQPLIEERTSSAAVASMILGILAFVTCGLTSIPAVICGHVSLSNIKRLGGRLGGRGMAIAGLITGYVSIGFLLLFIVGSFLAGFSLPVIAEVKHRAETARVTTQLKHIGLACLVYAEQHEGRFPSKPEELVPDLLAAEELVFTSSPGAAAPVFQYFGGSVSDGPNHVLATASFGTRPRKVVLYGDGRVESRADAAALAK
ncbi:MAG TPA: DUF4190 domain-containing protein [Chthoniobacteraceae bacterium]|jgi:hypothetical protein|nr:DUF4190 domain-containing protein [Chthoniobacteraceae bacterium]